LKSDDVSDWPLPNKIPGCAPAFEAVFFLRFSEVCRGGALGCQHDFPSMFDTFN